MTVFLFRKRMYFLSSKVSEPTVLWVCVTISPQALLWRLMGVLLGLAPLRTFCTSLLQEDSRESLFWGKRPDFEFQLVADKPCKQVRVKIGWYVK